MALKKGDLVEYVGSRDRFYAMVVLDDGRFHMTVDRSPFEQPALPRYVLQRSLCVPIQPAALSEEAQAQLMAWYMKGSQ